VAAQGLSAVQEPARCVGTAAKSPTENYTPRPNCTVLFVLVLSCLVGRWLLIQPTSTSQRHHPPITTTEEGSDLVEFSLQPHHESLLEEPPSQFFADFRLRELDENDAAAFNSDRVFGIGCVCIRVNVSTNYRLAPLLTQYQYPTSRFRGFLWFISLLYPYMGVGLLCSITARVLATQAGNPDAAPLDVLELGDFKALHGLVGTILGEQGGREGRLWLGRSAGSMIDTKTVNLFCHSPSPSYDIFSPDRLHHLHPDKCSIRQILRRSQNFELHPRK
jgi:hypothetical protein